MHGGLGIEARPFFEGLSPERDGKGEEEIAEGDGEIAFEVAEGEGANRACGEGKLFDAEDGEERGVFDDGREFASERGEDLAKGLGENDIAVSLGAGEADGLGGFELGFADAFDTCADDFAEIGAAEEGENQGTGEEAEIAGEGLAEDIPVAVNLHEERGASGDFDVESGEVAEGEKGASAKEGEGEADGAAEWEGEGGDGDGGDPTGPEEVGISEDWGPSPVVTKGGEKAEADEAEHAEGQGEADEAGEPGGWAMIFGEKSGAESGDQSGCGKFSWLTNGEGCEFVKLGLRWSEISFRGEVLGSVVGTGKGGAVNRSRHRDWRS